MNKTLGAKPFVGFNWQNGMLVEVSIVFDAYPANSTFPQISAAAKIAIAARFKQTPKQILIGFRVEGANVITEHAVSPLFINLITTTP